MAATVLSLMVLTIVALLAGAVYLWRQGRNRRRALLMLLLAAVIAANVALWTLPGSTGDTLVHDAPSDLSSPDAQTRL